MRGLITSLRARTPLGWKQLRHNPGRLAVALAGVAFADMLIFLQLGVMGALFDSAAKPLAMLSADIILISPDARAIGRLGTLPRRRLHQALGVDGVAGGTILQVGSAEIRRPDAAAYAGLRFASVTVFGIDPEGRAVGNPVIDGQRHMLRRPDVALLDRLTRSPLAPLVRTVSDGGVATAEISGRTVSMLGLYAMGASFESDGSLVVSDQTFLRLFPRSSAAAVSAVLLTVEPGQQAEIVAERLRQALPYADTKVMTIGQYAAYLRNFMQRNTPIGIVFSFGVVIGLLVGFAIVYQILSADVHDHLGEYATFRAMGFTQRWLLGVVFEQAFLLAAIGFVPGLVLSLGLYRLLGAATELSVSMPPDRALMVLGLTLLMCGLSGALATRRLAAADPADVF
jgi:putative ABC transport system permease protein